MARRARARQPGEGEINRLRWRRMRGTGFPCAAGPRTRPRLTRPRAAP